MIFSFNLWNPKMEGLGGMSAEAFWMGGAQVGEL